MSKCEKCEQHLYPDGNHKETCNPTYKWYTKNRKQIIQSKLAPENARPKYSKGDSSRFRFKQETIELRGWGGKQKVNELYIPKGGYLVHKVKKRG